MKTLRTVLTRALNVLAGVSFLAMVILTCWQVFTRYILSNPSSWSEELVSYLFAWMSLLGASLVTGGARPHEYPNPHREIGRAHV